jgi:hypothetical protein
MSNANSYCDYIFKHYWRELAGIAHDITVLPAEKYGVGYVFVAVRWRIPNSQVGMVEDYGPGHPSSMFLLINDRATEKSQYIEECPE